MSAVLSLPRDFFSFRPIYRLRLSRLALRDGVPVEVREHLLAHALKTAHGKIDHLLLISRCSLLELAQHALRVVHKLSGELHRVIGVRRHVRDEGGHHHLHGDQPAAQFVFRQLGHDFFSFTPAYRLGLKVPEGHDGVHSSSMEGGR